ncbi:MAG: hypothetical protein HGA47_11900 [Zoogloea sp.]|nr:hypothetical protein [Zoogloea sp.]
MDETSRKRGLECWQETLGFAPQQPLVEPARFTLHLDHAARAEKLIGVDHGGTPCFYFHSYVLDEDRFDEDEMPYVADVFMERMVAWRCQDGTWMRHLIQLDRLEHCPSRILHAGLAVMEAAPVR